MVVQEYFMDEERTEVLVVIIRTDANTFFTLCDASKRRDERAIAARPSHTVCQK